MSSKGTEKPQEKGDLGVVEAAAEAYGSKESGGGGGVNRDAPPHHVISSQIYEQVAATDETHSKGDGFCRGLCAGLCCYCCLDICF
ncbi:hypothetical protein QN277_014555 [Acacia crassicarpa]|uniref:Cysteine-rich transmembrane domain-containing protein n=1 Tax=Acacia crassicarpa TaxID=499986 RepID=A0AAE1ILY8_9FABA|nr:hypothetical protein QN277_014555 [Acacia crassicarpa]